MLGRKWRESGSVCRRKLPQVLVNPCILTWTGRSRGELDLPVPSFDTFPWMLGGQGQCVWTDVTASVSFTLASLLWTEKNRRIEHNLHSLSLHFAWDALEESGVEVEVGVGGHYCQC